MSRSNMRSRALVCLPVVLVLAACGSIGSLPSSTPATTVSPFVTSSLNSIPTPSAAAGATPSPRTIGPPYGVLVDLLTPPTFYYANVVAIDGTAWESMKFDKRTPISSAAGHAVVLPYVSTSSTALYALVGDSTVVSVRLSDRQAGPVVHLVGVGPNMEAAFAVSPDDSRIAVSVLDFGRTPVHVTLYTESIAGANHQVIFESDSNYVWPVAWHAGLLVLAHAYGPFEEDIAKAAPGHDNPYSAISYHIVDPANANRVYLLGACTVSGPLSPAGSGCIQGGTIDWQGNVSPPWSTTDWGQDSSAAALSPDGKWVAATVPGAQGEMAIWTPDGRVITYVDGPGARDWAGWIDDQHILTGSYLDSAFQPTVTNAVKDEVVHRVLVRGFYAARLPTDIV